MPIPTHWHGSIATLWISSPARIATVGVTAGETHLSLSKAGDKLTMQEPADHPALDESHLDDTQRALDLLTMQTCGPTKMRRRAMR